MVGRRIVVGDEDGVRRGVLQQRRQRLGWAFEAPRSSQKTSHPLDLEPLALSRYRRPAASGSPPTTPCDHEDDEGLRPVLSCARWLGLAPYALQLGDPRLRPSRGWRAYSVLALAGSAACFCYHRVWVVVVLPHPSSVMHVAQLFWCAWDCGGAVLLAAWLLVQQQTALLSLLRDAGELPPVSLRREGLLFLLPGGPLLFLIQGIILSLSWYTVLGFVSAFPAYLVSIGLAVLFQLLVEEAISRVRGFNEDLEALKTPRDARAGEHRVTEGKTIGCLHHEFSLISNFIGMIDYCFGPFLLYNIVKVLWSLNILTYDVVWAVMHGKLNVFHTVPIGLILTSGLYIANITWRAELLRDELKKTLQSFHDIPVGRFDAFDKIYQIVLGAKITQHSPQITVENFFPLTWHTLYQILWNCFTTFLIIVELCS